jgi:hypothetical protein
LKAPRRRDLATRKDRRRYRTRARLDGLHSPEWYLIEQEHVDLAPREQDPGLAREWIAEEAAVVLEVYLQDA